MSATLEQQQTAGKCKSGDCTTPVYSRKVTMKDLAPPYRIKMVEPCVCPDRAIREKAMKEAGYNTFLLPSPLVYIDLLTDSGTAAMSDNQWSGMMLGDEAYAGSRNFDSLLQSVQSVMGYKYMVPTHQGRAAEHLVAKAMVTRKGLIVPRQMYFTTSKEHVEMLGAKMVDVALDSAHDPTNNDPFKGNVDIAKVKKWIDQVGPENIPFVGVEANVNMAGGQPISLANMRALHEFLQPYKIPIIMDATRSSENAYFIREREPGQQNRPIIDILRELCSYTIGCTYSAKKDCLVNIGGFIGCNDPVLFEKCRNMVVVYEGLHTYGGMAGRDMEAVARGLREGTELAYLKSRIMQTRYMGQLLEEAGVPIVKPVGSHAVYLDALKFFPDMPRENWPSQTLAAALYVESGVRTMERGAVSKGRDSNGKNVFPKLELVRLTMPRRVYTESHVHHVVEGVKKVWAKRNTYKGLVMYYEPKQLRFFQAMFHPVGEKIPSQL